MGHANWSDKTIFTGDNLLIMRGMNSESVDLIYLDPPFNSKTDYAAPIGSKAAGAAFKDTWSLSDIDVEWINLMESKHPRLWRVLMAAMTPSDKSYLAYMAIRLLEIKRILKNAGSIYLHCDPTMSHYLKLVMDAVFSRKSFQNEIVWSYRRWPSKSKQFQTMHDTLLFYAGESHTFHVNYEQVSESYLKRFKGKTQILDPETKTRKLVVDKPTRGLPQRDVWDLSILAGSSKERLGYPTQKPLALLRRVIEASSNPKDLVFDPFCGCATTLVAAELAERNWTGIDISARANELVNERLKMPPPLGIGSLFHNRFVVHRKQAPLRTDLGVIPPYDCAANRNALYGAQSGNCAGCREHFLARNLTVDHIIAKANGGTDHLENLQLLCGYCNSVKGDRDMEYLKAKLQIAA